MVAETIETTPQQADQEHVETPQTEVPATEVVAEDAAEEKTEVAAAPEQVQVTEPEKPDYVTRADWEREKAEVEARAAADALELDRRRRQTENARRAQQEVRDREEQQEAADVIRASLVSQGLDPEAVTAEAVTRTVDRLARKKADRIAAGSLDTMDQAWDYITAPVYGKNVDLDESAAEAAQRLSPKVQHLVNQIRPAIEAEARKGYIAESELPRLKQTWAEELTAKSKEGQEELRRAPGSPASRSGPLTIEEASTLSIDELKRRTQAR